MKRQLLLFALLTTLAFPSLSQSSDYSLDGIPIEVDTSYVVYLGSFKKQKTFEQKDVPYKLVELKRPDGKFMYFFGKFETECDATHVQNLAYLCGYKKTQVREYVDYVENGDVQVYAHVCSKH